MAKARLGNLLVQINVGLGNLSAGMKQLDSQLSKQSRKLDKHISGQEKRLRQAGKKSQSKDSIFSPAWFKTRARWFIQLRAFWAVWQQLSKAVSEAFQFEQEMANVRAITQATNAQFEQLRQKALEVGSTTRFSATEAAKGMVIMSQAGLSVDEVLSSIKDVAFLATATLNDFAETASLIVTIMRAWGKEADQTKEITDILATSINKTKLTMKALATGFNFISGIAPRMNLSLEETTALMGILANRGLSASTAATSMRAVFAALLSPTDKFKKVLREVGLTAQDVDPRLHEFSSILETLRKAGFGAAEAFRAFRRRAAAGASILVGASKEFEELSKGMHDIGRASEMAAINLDTVQGQAKQAQDVLVALAADINRDLDPALKVLIQLMKELSKMVFALVNPLAKIVGYIGQWVADMKTFITGGFAGLEAEQAVQNMRELSNEFTQQSKKIDDVVQKYRLVKTALAEFHANVAAAQKAQKLGIETDLAERAIKQAEDRKLLTKEQVRELKNVKNEEERIGIAVEMVNKNFEETQSALALQLKTLKFIKEEIEATLLATAETALGPALDVFTATSERLKKEQDRQTAASEDFSNGLLTNFLGFMDGLLNISEDRMKILTENNNEAAQSVLSTLSNLTSKQIEALRKQRPELRNLLIAFEQSGGSLDLFVKLLDRATTASEHFAKASKKTIEALDVKTGEIATPLDPLRETFVQEKARLKVEQQRLDIQIKMAKAKTKELKVGASSVEKDEEELKLAQQINFLQQRKLDRQRRIVVIDGENIELKQSAIDLQERLNKLELTRVEILIKQRALNRTLKKQRLEVKAQIQDLGQALSMDKLRGAKNREILESEKEVLDTKKSGLELELKTLENADERIKDENKILEIKLQIDALEGNIAENLERQKLATSSLARWQAKLTREAPSTFGDFLNQEGGVIDTLMTTGTTGMEEGLLNIANLFGQQREEAAGLEAQLEGLNAEYQQAMSEGNIDRARQLQAQMGTLRNRIDELNDPLKNLGKTFKSFAILILKEVQKIIIKMLVMKLVMAAVGFATQQINISAATAAFTMATGGILPGGTFKNFRKFAKGGVTGGAGLAILGDNASGKELVIPSENIKEDEVSGFARDKKEQQPINIINVVTEQDIANTMSSPAGQRVIINTIGADIGKRGPTYRAMKS